MPLLFTYADIEIHAQSVYNYFQAPPLLPQHAPVPPVSLRDPDCQTEAICSDLGSGSKHKLHMDACPFILYALLRTL